MVSLLVVGIVREFYFEMVER